MDNLTPRKKEFIKAYDEWSDAVFRYCLFKVSNRDLALDLVQETFTKTWQYIVDGKKVDNIKAFVFRVANNLIIDEYRKSKSVSLDEIEEGGVEVGKTEGSTVTFSVEIKHLLRVIDKMPEKYREVILMRYVSGLPPKDIGKILGVSENVVSVRLNRALKKIQELLRL